MANIVEKIKQIRQAVYGKDVRESIASSLEEMNKDNVEAIQSANTAIESANTANENANEAIQSANTAAQAATQAASSADTAASSANTAAQAASDLVDDISAKLANGELNGKDGKDGKDGELGGDTVPVGSIFPLATNVIPDGWLLCDGSTVSRSEYSELFAVIGETYGAGDGSTTFALPNEPNPLTYTKSDETIQFAEHEPPLYMIIKAKQVIPIAGGIVNDVENESETDALSARATKNAIEQSASELSARIPNPNMLINGDFGVWQRGTSFVKANAIYTADRCFVQCSQSAAVTVSKAENGLQFMCEKECAIAPYKYFMEENDLKKVRGSTATLSYSVDGVVHSFTLNDFGQLYIQDDTILESHTLSSTDSSLSNCVIVIRYTNMAVGESRVLNWVKLELGEVATPLVPRPYAEELMMCKRYFNVVNLQSRFTLANADGTTFGTVVYNGVPMNRVPDVKGIIFPFTLSYRYDGKNVADNITAVSAKAYGENIAIEFKGDKSAAVNTTGYLINSSNIQLDAEIYD